MRDKVLNLIKSRDMTIPRFLLFNYKNLNITEEELVVLIYLLNSNGDLYNPKDISEDLKYELVDVLTIVSDLTEKGVININMETRGSKSTEVVDLEPLYSKLTTLVVNEEKEKDTTIFTSIENEFARALTPMEYELVNAWMDNGYSEELINEALKEAVYNNVTSLKYIDKILEAWSKKGIKTKEDVATEKKKFKERKQVKNDSFYYDWLNDEE